MAANIIDGRKVATSRREIVKNEVNERWDSEKIRADVVATQKHRRSVYQAMSSGVIPSWDYNPPRDASQQYVRNHMDWSQAAAKTRFPPLPD